MLLFQSLLVTLVHGRHLGREGGSIPGRHQAPGREGAWLWVEREAENGFPLSQPVLGSG